jgi:hypothetical protein
MYENRYFEVKKTYFSIIFIVNSLNYISILSIFSENKIIIYRMNAFFYLLKSA